MNTSPSAPDEEQHREAMQALQADMHEKMRAAKEKRGLIIVHTGDGKGKSTAGFGMLARMLAHGKRCGVVQFIKSSDDAVERIFRGPLLAWHHVGGGFTWDTQNRADDIARCREGWKLVADFLRPGEVDFVLLDELNVVLAYEYLPLDEVLATLETKGANQHIVITGRGAPAKLIERADLVTEMREIKHPFKSGVKAQRGIEY